MNNPYEEPAWTEMEHGIFHPGEHELTKRLISLSGIHSDASILDIGCGMGASLAYLRNRGYNAIG